MEFTPDIINDLSPEEIRFLKFIPPHTLNCDAVVHKNFGIMLGNDVFQFRYDLLNFHDSVTRLARVRNREMNENRSKNCAKYRLIMNLQHMNDKVQELSNKKMRKVINKTVAEKCEGITIVAAPNIIDEKSEEITIVAAPDIIDDKSENIITAASNAADEKSEDIHSAAPNAADEIKNIHTVTFNTHDERYDIAGHESSTSRHRVKREKESTNNEPEVPEIVTATGDDDENDNNDEVGAVHTDEFDSMIEKAKDVLKETKKIYEFVLYKKQ
ncbi:hypothetical protein PV327_011044 [Microctonus hyperodae]|uniref:Uncharacterized protein n=1 Tax=Microctonus hyperodae TaxID=165561 RepID=A0AA39C7U5_MICHY|nr:hypothetical protein PV327_011044 [Microctonus hyperodae]